MKKLLLFLFFSIYAISSQAQIKILFDATKDEMAGNADWVIDADSKTNGESNPQRIPTPAQSGITANTSETYWTGALSAWAVDLVKQGYYVETLPISGKITYGDSSNVQDLSNYNVYIVCEPNNSFTSSEKTAIINFVKNGGGLYIIADHDISDRDNDGVDSPAAWNDLFTNNTVKSNPFGISFDKSNISLTSSNFANSTTNTTILNGKAGKPTQIQFFNGSSMTLNSTANNTVKGLIFNTGASNTGTTNVLFATATYGSGKICALGDSSVPDDGSGDTGDSLYNGYFADAAGNHQPLLVNSVIWLATSSALGTNDILKPQLSIEIYPNPSADDVFVKSTTPEKYNLTLIDSSGKTLLNITNADKISIKNYPKGLYYLIVKNDKGFRSFKLEKK